MTEERSEVRGCLRGGGGTSGEAKEDGCGYRGEDLKILWMKIRSVTLRKSPKKVHINGE